MEDRDFPFTHVSNIELSFPFSLISPRLLHLEGFTAPCLLVQILPARIQLVLCPFPSPSQSSVLNSGQLFEPSIGRNQVHETLPSSGTVLTGYNFPLPRAPLSFPRFISCLSNQNAALDGRCYTLYLCPPQCL